MKKLISVALLALTLGVTAPTNEAQAGTNSGYICQISAGITNTTIRLYSGSYCSGAFVGDFIMKDTNYSSDQRQVWSFDRLNMVTAQLIENRWSRVLVDTGSSGFLFSVTFLSN